jgi:hypothetical protein
MANVTREQIDQALQQRDGYTKATPEQQAAYREKAYAAFGITGEEVGAPKAGLQSQGIRAPQELTTGIIRESPKLHPVFGAIDRLSPGTGGEMQGVFNREAIPTLLTVGGGALGAGARLGAVGKAILEASGSGIGGGINQATGIEPPNGLQLAGRIVAPMAARGTMSALQQAPRLLPGASAALQEEAVGQARNIPSLIRPPAQSSDTLYSALEKAGNPRMELPTTMSEMGRLQKIEGHIAEGLKSEPLLTVIEGLKNKTGGGGMTFQEIKENLERLGKKIGSTTDAELKGAYKDLYKSLLTDLETASTKMGGEPAKLFQQARQAYRRELAQRELQDVITEKGITKQGEFLDQFNPNAVSKWMTSTKDGQYFMKSVTPDELKAINATLKELSQVPTVPVKRGAPIGSGRRLGIVGAGGAVGGVAGGGMGAAVGMLAADKGAELISRALTSDTGRSVLLKVLRASGGQFGQREAAVVSAALAGELGNALNE